MAYRVNKTEHNGAKRGRSFWGRKAEAKHQSSRIRRKHSAEQIRNGLGDGTMPEVNPNEKAIQE
jgi:hypothetical protein